MQVSAKGKGLWLYSATDYCADFSRSLVLYKWALGSITVNKASAGDGILGELFQILKDDAVKVLHSICQQIWKTQQRPQDWKNVNFHSIPEERQCQRMLKLPHNCTHFTCWYIMLKILQARLQQYVNRETPDV